jgi:hypothetical protein
VRKEAVTAQKEIDGREAGQCINDAAEEPEPLAIKNGDDESPSAGGDDCKGNDKGKAEGKGKVKSKGKKEKPQVAPEVTSKKLYGQLTTVLGKIIVLETPEAIENAKELQGMLKVYNKGKNAQEFDFLDWIAGAETGLMVARLVLKGGR